MSANPEDERRVLTPADQARFIGYMDEQVVKALWFAGRLRESNSRRAIEARLKAIKAALHKRIDTLLSLVEGEDCFEPDTLLEPPGRHTTEPGGR